MARHPFFKRKNHETLKCGGSGRLPLRQVPCIQEGKTKFDYNSFMFECPGGKIEPGETLKQTLKRELMEEMNYEIEVGKELVTVTHSYPDFNITMMAFLCTAASPTFVIIVFPLSDMYSWYFNHEIGSIFIRLNSCLFGTIVAQFFWDSC